jgi:hypothetical protein
LAATLLVLLYAHYSIWLSEFTWRAFDAVLVDFGGTRFKVWFGIATLGTWIIIQAIRRGWREMLKRLTESFTLAAIIGAVYTAALFFYHLLATVPSAVEREASLRVVPPRAAILLPPRALGESRTPNSGAVVTFDKAAKILIFRSYGVQLQSKMDGGAGVLFTARIENTGLVPAVGMTTQCRVALVGRELTVKEQTEIIDGIFDFPLNQDAMTNEIQPGERRFFSCPDTDDKIRQLAIQAAKMNSLSMRYYLFATMRYRDESLPRGFVWVTEFGGWFSGNDLEVRHVIGRNRVLKVRERNGRH